MAHDNKMLGQFRLDGIRPARRGEPRIEVKFAIDVNGIVTVAAKDLDTQKEQHITISGSTGLSKEEIDRMVKEAEANKEADAKRKDEVEVRNRAEQAISQIDQALAQGGDKIAPNVKDEALKTRNEMKEALDKNDIETLKKKLDELERQASYARQAADQANGTQQQAGANPNAGQADTSADQGQQPSGQTDDGKNVYDADYTEKKK